MRHDVLARLAIRFAPEVALPLLAAEVPVETRAGLGDEIAGLPEPLAHGVGGSEGVAARRRHVMAVRAEGDGVDGRWMREPHHLSEAFEVQTRAVRSMPPVIRWRPSGLKASVSTPSCERAIS
jgi:hypothetical protein